MLRRLFIRNYALIDHLELEPEEGFTVLTGETGAGKSILVGALGLLLGGRAERQDLATAPGNTEISAEFDAPAPDTELHRLLRSRDLQPAAEEALALRRVVDAKGRGRAYVNASPVPLQLLREIGVHLADLQSQHAQHSLRRPDIRLALLDAGGDCGEPLRRVRGAYTKWEQAQRALAAQSGTRDEDQLEALRGRLAELVALDAGKGELEKLLKRQTLLASAEELVESCADVLQILEGEDALLKQLYRMRERLLALPAAESLEAPTRLMEEAHIQLQEAASDLRRFTADLESDPEQLQQVENRLQELHYVARKQHIPPEELQKQRTLLEQRLREQTAAEAHRAQLQQRLQTLHEAYLKVAATLGKHRRKQSGPLAQAVRKSLAELGMSGPRFLMELQELPPQKPRREGLQRVDFLFSANPDRDPAPLEKVASGGELARLCLALLTVCGGHRRDLPLLIFDEVDAGVGGATGELIGRLLAALAKGRQLLCVTHLPQLAACAKHHYRIWKERDKDGRTRTCAAPLQSTQRVEELARMLGGVKITPRTRAHAKELLATLGEPSKQ